MTSFTEPEVVGMSSARLARVAPSMQAFVDNYGFSGISTLIARRGTIVHTAQVGAQDRDTRTPLAPDTIFRIYSMTKPVICTAAMTLFEEGRFQLTDPVARYLPAFAQPVVLAADGSNTLTPINPFRPILVGDLFTHTAGLTYSFLDDSPVGGLYRQANLLRDPKLTLEQMIAELARLPLAYAPGTRWHYSISIDVIAHLIEVISGKPLTDFLQERLFTPLGMQDTGFRVPHSQRQRVATVYGHPDIMESTLGLIFEAWMQGNNDQIAVEATHPIDSPSFVRGGHGLFSTISDYFRFAQMLLNGGVLDDQRILGRKTIEFMHMNHIPAHLLPLEIGGNVHAGYGFGLGSRVRTDVAAAGVPGSVGEYGWAGAAKTFYWVDPKEELVGILMTQFMVGFETPEKVLQTLAYQAVID